MNPEGVLICLADGVGGWWRVHLRVSQARARRGSSAYAEQGRLPASHALRTTVARLDFAHHVVDNIVEQETAGDHPYTPGRVERASVAGPPSPP